MSRAYDDKDIWQCQKPLRLLLLLSCFHTGDQCVPTPVTTTVSNCDIMQQRVCSHCKECCVKSTVLIGPAHQAAVTVSSLVSTMTLHVSQTRSWWQTVFLKKNKNQLFFTICNHLGLSKLRIKRQWTHHTNKWTCSSLPLKHCFVMQNRTGFSDTPLCPLT